MGRILDARGDEALDLLAELIVPAQEIISDPDVLQNLATGGKKVVAVQKALKDHKGSVTEMLAIDDGVSVDEEREMITAVSLPFRVLTLLGNKEIQQLFFGLAETNKTATGSSAASTKESE